MVALVLIKFSFISDGYAKLQDRPSSDERIIDSDHDEEGGTTSRKKDVVAEAKQDAVVKSASKTSSDSLFGAPARIMKMMEKTSYRQFVDADSDDFDKEEKLMVAEVACASRPQADSSSEGHDNIDKERYNRKKDFNYKELDDEFGSKRSMKPAHDQSGQVEDSSDQSRSQYEDYDPLPPPMFNRTPNSKVPTTASQQHDRIVGHEYGVRPLLDDDELSESETGQNHKEVAGSSRGSSAMSASSSAFVGIGTPPMSPQSQQSDQDTSLQDVFLQAPFSGPKRSSRKKHHKLMCSPPVRVDDDPFSKVPFVSSRNKLKSPLDSLSSSIGSGGSMTYVNQAVMAENDMDIFGNAPFKGTKSPLGKGYSAESSTCSPATIEMRSPSQSPDAAGLVLGVGRVHTPNRPGSDIAMQTAAPTPPISPRQVDLFGSGNFSNVSFHEARAMQRHGQQQHQQWPPQQAPPVVTNVPKTMSSPQPSPASPSQDLFGCQPFQDSGSLDALSLESRKLIQDNSAGRNYMSVASGGVKKSTNKSTPTRPRKNSGSRHRRNGSSDSRSSGSEPSPRSSKKDKYFSHSTEYLHDENMDVLGADSGNYGSLKKSKHKVKKQAKQAAPTTAAFSNLSFCDDSEKDQEVSEEGSPYRSESHTNLATEALKTNNAANYLEEGSHTLPRTGGKKSHRILPTPPDQEPFSMKKKGMFK